jgi:hypothetical protein
MTFCFALGVTAAEIEIAKFTNRSIDGRLQAKMAEDVRKCLGLYCFHD